MNSGVVKVGPKGQIQIKKELRDEYGLQPGRFVETIRNRNGILIKAFDAEGELKKLQKFRQEISKKWPKGLDCVDLIREQRK